MTGKVAVTHNTTHYLWMHYREFLQGLVAKGWEVVVVAPRDEAADRLEAAGVRCEDIRMSRRGLNPFREIRLVTAMARILRRERPQVLFNYSIKPVIYGSLLGRLLGIENIYSTITGLGYVFMEGSRLKAGLKALVIGMYRIALRNNACVFFQNSNDRDLFVRYRIIDSNRTLVVPGTGIDIQAYSPRSGARTARSFVLIARLLKDKGIREYYQAAKNIKTRYPDATFRLVGSIDENPLSVSEAELESWQAAGVIEYLGEVQDVRPILAQTQVFVLPSYYREGTPRVNLEAMAMGMPIITTDWPGCRDTVEHETNGYLVPVKDSNSLQQAMIRFVEHPELVPAMGQQSRILAEQKYNVDAVNQLIYARMSI